MKIKYDQQVDAAYLTLETAEIVDSEEVQPNVVFDYDECDRVIGIELLSVKRNIPNLLELPKLLSSITKTHRNFDFPAFFNFLVKTADLNLIENEKARQRIKIEKISLEKSPANLRSPFPVVIAPSHP